jgi:multiple sugar transport system ATP-binding protein
MANLSLRNLTKTYPGGVKAGDCLSLEIPEREFVVFVGPSGCGKTATLQMIAGLEDITEGDLLMDGQRINNVLPKGRDMAMVFQNYALYPHMTVYDNIAFGLKLRKAPKVEIKRRIMETARILEIDHLLDRKPKALSSELPWGGPLCETPMCFCRMSRFPTWMPPCAARSAPGQSGAIIGWQPPSSMPPTTRPRP